jgi:hypothetical protein
MIGLVNRKSPEAIYAVPSFTITSRIRYGGACLKTLRRINFRTLWCVHFRLKK